MKSLHFSLALLFHVCKRGNFFKEIKEKKKKQLTERPIHVRSKKNKLQTLKPTFSISLHLQPKKELWKNLKFINKTKVTQFRSPQHIPSNKKSKKETQKKD